MPVGYKFEALSLLPDQWHLTPREYIEGREAMIVSNKAQYCSVVKTGIGKAKLVIGGEVDACMRFLTYITGNPADSPQYGIADRRTKTLLSIGSN